MIHNVQTSASGDYRDMDNTGNALRAANQSIMNAYTDKTGDVYKRQAQGTAEYAGKLNAGTR